MHFTALLMTLKDRKMHYNEYYQFYLSKHQSVNNRKMHVLGNAMTILYLIIVIPSYPLAWLLLTPFIVYPFAFLGHWLFEGNKPALFSSNPIKAKLADIRMCYDFLLGKI
jgi:hypothetical protein